MFKRTTLLAMVLLASNASADDLGSGVVAHAMGHYDKAMAIMTALAEGSDHEIAQYYIGFMYANGQGVRQDYKEAAKWYRLAAEKGVPQAQYRLAELYAKGLGTPKDHERAYAWYSVAVAQGYEQASKPLAVTREKLSRDELNEADKLSGEFIEKYTKKPDSGE